MDQHDQPAQPTPADTPRADQRPHGLRRGFATAILAAGLLVVGGAAVVTAASPDPSASAAPGATQPSENGSTAPSESARPGRGTGEGCPNKGAGNGTTDTGGSSG